MIAAVAEINAFNTLSVKSLYLDFADHELEGQTFQHGDLFPLQEHQMWTIEQGFVRTVNYSDAGDTVTLGLWSAGDVVGKPLSDRLGYEVECLTFVKARPIQLTPVELSEARSIQVRQMEIFLNILYCRRLPQRLWMLLDWLTEKYGQPSDRGCVLDMRLTHQAIADMIGSTRVTVTRLLNDFEKAGQLAKLGHQKILIYS